MQFWYIPRPMTAVTRWLAVSLLAVIVLGALFYRNASAAVLGDLVYRNALTAVPGDRDPGLFDWRSFAPGRPSESAQGKPAAAGAGLETIQIRPNVFVVFGAGGN